MGKPLLTDEIIARAEAGDYEQHSEAFDDEDTLILDRHRLSQERHDTREKTAFVKSRRVENAKRSAFQSKVNRVLVIVILLVILLIWAVFKF
ncbi:cell wall synthase accessory phosphoprotein MacP [Streptococcus saliviloxodontae]|uniref:Foldase n=1 Tax=Streptococcus saliviloxodontae TaxID=1349416 RepID=A0ABS2PKA6_9STRE|nr:cell wall synthase accessory phosphoprotein MacP [Streptococcus saliviloxodontae]MBM7635789.1 hypothetical protein [Streptococcus saliviloxodontae]